MSQSTSSNQNATESLLHDQLTHYLMQHRGFAKLFFQTILDKATVRDIQWKTFQRLHDRYTSHNLHGTVNDIAYTAIFKKTCQLLLMFVLEHKSYPPGQEYPIQYQLLYYANQHLKQFYDNRRKNKEEDEAQADLFPTPQPLLIVIYHGQRKWNVPTLAEHYRKADTNAFLQSQVMHIPYVLYDLSKQTDAQIISFYGKAISFCAGMLALKHIWDEDMLPVVKQLANLYDREKAKGAEVEKRKAVFVYLLRALTKQDDYDRITNYLRKNKKEELMSYFDTVLAEREAKGIEQGIEKGIEKGKAEGNKEGLSKSKLAVRALKAGQSVAYVAREVGLPLQEVAELQEAMGL